VLWLVGMCGLSSCGCLLMNDVESWLVMKLGLLMRFCRNGMLEEMLWIWNFVRVWWVCCIVVGKLCL